MATALKDPSSKKGRGIPFLGGLLGILETLLTPILAIITALIIGAILIWLAGRDPIIAYQALIDGSLLQPRGLVQTILKMTPLLLSGLAVGFAFKAGLFNIGAQGQLIMGSVTAAWIGSVDFGIAPVFHIILAMLAATMAGSLWGAIPGILKAYRDAHEVITTIMFNFIASRIAEWVISTGSTVNDIPPGPLADPNAVTAEPTSQPIQQSAELPIVFEVPGTGEDLNIGIFIAIAMAILVVIILNRTTFGFELKMTGQNPDAARYAGVSVNRVTVLTMAIAGGLAGIAGGIQTLGINGNYRANQSLGLGFDSITVSLLAGNDPIGTVFSSFLFATMEQGSTRMAVGSGGGVDPELIFVIQALILMFVAAPQIIRFIYRINLKSVGGSFRTNWG